MNFSAIIATRRDGKRHTEPELRFLAEGAAKGTAPDYQIAAWLMAAYLNPLNAEETAWLTRALAESGATLDLTGLPKPWVDKHSTGGVGDKTTLVLLPLLAACGLTVVKMSGRGLGITGGTVDKLASIPGFDTDLTPDAMKAQAARIGLALTGQTPDLAPADKTLYALRDVTGTVGSIPLIVSSILSKKMAGGAETIVLDVKAGSGAFMKTEAEARQLASALQATGRYLGLNLRLALTDMTQPLGGAVGNALEVKEAFAILRGEPIAGPVARFRDLCVTLAGLTLAACGKAADVQEGRDQAELALSRGDAAAKASVWMEAQGAPSGILNQPEQLASAPVRRELMADQAGWIEQLDAETVGQAVLDLGGGRRQKTDLIDPAVGVVVHRAVGDRVEEDEATLTVHAATEASAEAALGAIRAGIRLAKQPVAPRDVILEIL